MNTQSIINTKVKVSQELLIELMHKKIFNNLLTKGKISKSEIERKINKFKASYAHIEEKFSHRTRDNGEDSFEHQKEVVYLMLQLSKNPSFEKVMILLDHDTIEDTNITIEGMRENHNDDLVFPIALMTKKPFCDYINSPKHLQTFQKIRISWILNTKWTLNDEFHYKELYKEQQLSHKEKRAYQLYEWLRKRYKHTRNKDYCSQMKSFDALLQHALYLNKDKSFNFSEEKIRSLVIDTIECKLWDRLHGIMTLKNCNLEKIERKIEETQNDFKQIALQFFPYIWEFIDGELKKINEFLMNQYKQSVKWQISELIQTYGKQNCFDF